MLGLMWAVEESPRKRTRTLPCVLIFLRLFEFGLVVGGGVAVAVVVVTFTFAFAFASVPSTSSYVSISPTANTFPDFKMVARLPTAYIDLASFLLIGGYNTGSIWYAISLV
jgi:hypothetical protein